MELQLDTYPFGPCVYSARKIGGPLGGLSTINAIHRGCAIVSGVCGV